MGTPNLHNDLQSLYWMGTSFRDEFSEDELTKIGVVAAVWQRERCPNTSRLHWQWCIKFAKRKRFSQVQKLFVGDHIERVRDISGAVNYCRKEDTRYAGPYQLGVFMESGTGEPMVVKLRNKRVKTALEEEPGLWRSVRAMFQIRLMQMPKRDKKTQLIYLWGPSGSGKTFSASRLGGDIYYHDGSAWWDNYDQEETVIVDEYRGNFPTTLLLKLGDYTPLKVPIKGGYVEFNSSRVVFISNLTPNKALFEFDDEATVEALARRFVLRYQYSEG